MLWGGEGGGVGGRGGGKEVGGRGEGKGGRRTGGGGGCRRTGREGRGSLSRSKRADSREWNFFPLWKDCLSIVLE